MDSPMSFLEKVNAARIQLKDHGASGRRSVIQDLDSLFAAIRPDLPATRPGSGDSAFGEPTSTTEEAALLDITREEEAISSASSAASSIAMPSSFQRANSILRRRPESFASDSMAELARKAQEQERVLLEGARETARKHQEKKNSASPHMAAATPGQADLSVPAITSAISPTVSV